MKTILFVCTANICRSPMAAALMRQRIVEMGLAEQIQVTSAGVWASQGSPASDYAIATLAGRGVALEGHRAQPLDLPLLEQADVVLVMEEAHRRSIFYWGPQYLHKVLLLSELVGRHEDIPDPYGGSMEEYAQTATLLQTLIDAGLPRLLKQLGVTREAADVARE